MESIATPPFSPRRRESCFCGSGEKFKDCCGSVLPGRAPPHGVLLKPDVFDRAQCEQLVALAGSSKKEWLTVGDVDSETGDVGSAADSGRVTQGVRLGEREAVLNRLIGSVWRDVVEPTLDVEIEWFERPDILCYTAGGHYGSHADSEYFDEAAQLWRRAQDRDLSLLIYINADFEGGKLNFINFNYRYAPTVGDLLVFPSDHRYKHQAETVDSGTRYCIVSWAAVVGGPRCSAQRPDNAMTIAESQNTSLEAGAAASEGAEASEKAAKKSWWQRWRS